LESAGARREEIGEVVVVGGSTRLREVRELISNYFGGKELLFSANPDHAHAYGAIE